MTLSPLRICIQIICIFYFAFLVLFLVILYSDYYPSPCAIDNKQCLKNYVVKTPDPLLKLWVYSSTSQSPNGSDLYPVWELDDFKPNEGFTKDVTVRLPLGMHNNGTMFIHVFVNPVEEGGRGEDSPFEADWVVNQTRTMTYTPQITSADPPEKQEVVAGDHLTSQWRSHLTFNVMTTDVQFNIRYIPGELTNYLRPYDDQYLPMVIIKDVNFRSKDLMPLNNTCKEMPLRITYAPVSYGTLAMRMSMEALLNKRSPDLSEKKIEEYKDAISNNFSRYLLAMFIMASCLPILLFSLESDICFWKERKTMGGLSTQSAVWYSVGVTVLFLELVDKTTNSEPLVAVLMSIVIAVETWKLFKIFKARICWMEWRLVFDNADVSDKERETQALDVQAMRCLSCVLYPAWVGMITYTLMHNFHKSWYSLCLLSLANGFRWFSWVFDLPQVFINYKLKSVADLPWKVLTYRIVAIFILRMCHFCLAMPSDDEPSFPSEVIFVIFLYQRWLYNSLTLTTTVVGNPHICE